MVIKYLGTAAAEGIPALFCDCDVCRKARLLGGKDVRTRSQAIIDGKLLLDFPCDTFMHLIKNDLDLCDVSACLITHVHDDHFYPRDMSYIRRGFSHPPKGYVFTVYGSEDILDGTKQYEEESDGMLKFVAVKPFVPFDLLGFAVTPLKALHGTSNPYIYIIEKDGKTLLYAHDTGIFPDETWDYLRGKRLDMISLDCTEGAKETLSYDAHMCLGFASECRDRLASESVIDSGTVCVLNHFSHNGKDVLYDDFSKLARARGFLTSYDGFEISL